MLISLEGLHIKYDASFDMDHILAILFLLYIGLYLQKDTDVMICTFVFVHLTTKGLMDGRNNSTDSLPSRL